MTFGAMSPGIVSASVIGVGALGEEVSDPNFADFAKKTHHIGGVATVLVLPLDPAGIFVIRGPPRWHHTNEG